MRDTIYNLNVFSGKLIRICERSTICWIYFTNIGLMVNSYRRIKKNALYVENKQKTGPTHSEIHFKIIRWWLEVQV